MRQATREAFGQTLAELAVQDPDIIVLDADLAPATKTGETQKTAPGQFVQVGIAEGNMAGIAAGMAVSGLKPFASSFAMFLAGRAYEQIRNSIAYPHLNVKLCATHAGITVGEDGGSHQCLEDIGLMRMLPGMMVLQPADGLETAAMVKWLAGYEGPAYLRLSRAAVDPVYEQEPVFDPAAIPQLRSGETVALIASGVMVRECLAAADRLSGMGIEAAVYDLPVIKPLNTDLLNEIITQYAVVFVAEEHLKAGGIGSAIREAVREPQKIRSIAIEDRFGQSGSVEALMQEYGLDAKAIVQRVLDDCARRLYPGDAKAAIVRQMAPAC
ncbi:transketolase family protein [Faecalibaculum rodentium]|uniref:transketolase family protein n=1 Tax=Faecalibaculum rodentium TaxID=1702221 RepID=UPI0023F566B7|nr:transketolase C-terminal domain-containing protein [Faecalibaculum rodentium]